MQPRSCIRTSELKINKNSTRGFTFSSCKTYQSQKLFDLHILILACHFESKVYEACFFRFATAILVFKPRYYFTCSGHKSPININSHRTTARTEFKICKKAGRTHLLRQERKKVRKLGSESCNTISPKSKKNCKIACCIKGEVIVALKLSLNKRKV